MADNPQDLLRILQDEQRMSEFLSRQIPMLAQQAMEGGAMR